MKKEASSSEVPEGSENSDEKPPQQLNPFENLSPIPHNPFATSTPEAAPVASSSSEPNQFTASVTKEANPFAAPAPEAASPSNKPVTPTPTSENLSASAPIEEGPSALFAPVSGDGAAHAAAAVVAAAPNATDNHKHDVKAKPKKISRRWVAIGSAAAIAAVGLPTIGFVATKTIPSLLTAKKADKIEAAITAQTNSTGSEPKAITTGSEPKQIESPNNAQQLQPVHASLASKPTQSTPPATSAKHEPLAPVDIVGLSLNANAPVWRATGKPELSSFLHQLWRLDDLKDDPFYEFGETVVSGILEGNGALSHTNQIALSYLSRKMQSYPLLTSAALNLMPLSERVQVAEQLEPLIQSQNQPWLTAQMAVTAARGQNDPNVSAYALQAFEIAVQQTQQGDLSDEAWVYLLSEKFVHDLPISYPDHMIEIVDTSEAIPQWIKDYKVAEISYHDAILTNDSLTISETNNEAKKRLEASWQANSNQVEAPTMMIKLFTSWKSMSTDDIRRWFDRAIAVRADHKPAYINYLQALTDRQSDDEQLALRFAQSCVEAPVLNSSVQLCELLVDTHIMAAKASGKPSIYWKSLNPAQRQQLDTMFGALKQRDLMYDGIVEQSTECVIKFLTRDEPACIQCIHRLPREFDSSVTKQFNLKDIEVLQVEAFIAEHQRS